MKCDTCSLYRKDLCTEQNSKCKNHLPAKANCRWCVYAETCMLLDKQVGIYFVCKNFKKRDTALSRKIFPDYNLYLEKNSIKSSTKNNSSKKKIPLNPIEEGKDEDFSFRINNNPLPLKKEKKKKAKDTIVELSYEDSFSKDLWSPVDVIDNIIESDFDPRVFELVDDRILDWPTNILEFLTGPKYLANNLFPRQWQIALDYFSCYCPWCSDTDFIRNKIVVDTPIDEIQDRIVLYNKGVCPKCGRTRVNAFNDSRHKHYNQLAACVGQRAGKSKTVAFFSAGVLNQYLMLPNPVRFMRQIDSETFHMTFVGLRYQDAVDNLWQPFYNVITQSPWFKQYHEFLTNEGIRLGTELFKVRDSFIVYTYKNIACEPSGPDKRKLRGKTRIGACLTKNSLVNTGRGLQRIGEDLLGETAYVDNKLHPIVNWQCTGVKPVFTLKTKYGYTLHLTANHPVRVLNEDCSLGWKRTDELNQGDYVAIGLGGSFPNQLKLNFVDDTQRNTYEIVLDRISKCKIFTKVSILKGLSYRGIYSLTHDLIKDGAIRKIYSDDKRHKQYKEKSKEDCRLCVYEVLPNFDVNKYKSRKSTITFPKKMIPELGALIGYLVSEGNISLINTEVNFSNTNKKIVDHYCECFEKVFNVKPNVSTFIPRDENRKQYWQVRFTDPSIKKFLQYLGLSFIGAKNKSIPWSILQADKESIVFFIKALYEGDGSFPCSYSSISKKLILELQTLFLKFRVVTTISRNGKGVYNLRGATTYDEDVFLNNLGFFFKNNKKYVPFKEKRVFKLNCYSLPYIRYEVNYGIDKPAKVFLPKELRDKNSYALKRCKKENIEKYNNILSTLDRDFIYLPVSYIRDTGKELPVYDITVDSSQHEFIANGIVVHNSIDEIGWFSGKDGNIMLDPDEVATALDNSLMTIRTAVKHVLNASPFAPTAHGFWISSPSSKLDKIMRLYKQSKTSDTIYGVKLPTWEYNPNITKADLKDKYTENPVNAERDFGANPPFSDSPFIRSPADMIPLLSKHANAFSIERYRLTKDSLGTNLRYPIINMLSHDIPACLSIDCGFSQNAFAVALAHWIVKDEETEDENGNTVIEKVKYPACTGLLEIEPISGTPLSFPKIYDNVILPICNEFNVKLVAFDRWQSIDLRQRVYADTGIDAVQYSVNMIDFETIRTYIYSGDLILPKLDGEVEDLITLDKDVTTLTKNKPVSNFILQCLLSKDTGRIITKGGEISDDILRAATLGLTLLDHPDYEDLFDVDSTDMNRFKGVPGLGIGNSMGSLSGSGSVNTVAGVGCSISFGR